MSAIQTFSWNAADKNSVQIKDIDNRDKALVYPLFACTTFTFIFFRRNLFS